MKRVTITIESSYNTFETEVHDGVAEIIFLAGAGFMSLIFPTGKSVSIQMARVRRFETEPQS